MRWTVAVTAMVAGAALVAGSAVPAVAAGGYTVTVEQRTPEVKHFDSFRYDTVRVTGPDAEMAKELQRKIRSFTSRASDYYRYPSAKTRAYLKKAEPAYFDAIITLTEGCHRHYVCVSQATSFGTPLIAGSITGIEARAWSTKTGRKAALRDFVTKRQLPAFTETVKDAIGQDRCYYGFEIELPAKYSSFPHWVPLNDGIAVWFPEYQFGHCITAVRVSWP